MPDKDAILLCLFVIFVYGVSLSLFDFISERKIQKLERRINELEQLQDVTIIQWTNERIIFFVFGCLVLLFILYQNRFYVLKFIFMFIPSKELFIDIRDILKDWKNNCITFLRNIYINFWITIYICGRVVSIFVPILKDWLINRLTYLKSFIKDKIWYYILKFISERVILDIVKFLKYKENEFRNFMWNFILLFINEVELLKFIKFSKDWGNKIIKFVIYMFKKHVKDELRDFWEDIVMSGTIIKACVFVLKKRIKKFFS